MFLSCESRYKLCGINFYFEMNNIFVGKFKCGMECSGVYISVLVSMVWYKYGKWINVYVIDVFCGCIYMGKSYFGSFFIWY